MLRQRLLDINTWYGFAWLVFYFGVCTFVCSLWLLRDMHLHNCAKDGVHFVSVDQNTTRRPYALRALYPMLMKGSHELLDKEIRTNIARSLERKFPSLKKFAKRSCTPPHLLLDFLIFAGVTWLCFFSFLFVVKKIFQHVFVSRGWKANLVAPMALLFMSYLFRQGGHFFYDPFVLALVPLAVLLFAQKKWLLFYVALSFAFINKETAVVISLAFAAYTYGDLPRKTWFKHLLGQACMYAALRVGLWTLFDPGTESSQFDNYLRGYLQSNLFLLWNAAFWFDYSAQVALVAVAIAVFYGFKDQPRLFRSASLMTLPLMVGYFKVVCGRSFAFSLKCIPFCF
ncbi:MAG: hypothetical protein IPJ88_08095 [Myxococcales bacterium]|nr:MAG: hypothetical protein IPJ88_08095 [Myxococcales bacterium]